MATAGVPARSEQVVRSMTVAALVVVGAVYLVYTWDRFVFSVELVEVRRALGIPLGQAGLLASIFTFGLALVAIPAGFVVRRLGTRTVLVGGSVVFSLATGYTALGTGFGDVLVARVVTGVGEGLFNVALFTYLGSLSGRLRGTAVGIGASLFGVGALTGPLVVAGMLSGSGDWRFAFLVLAGLGLVGAAAILLTTRGSAAQSREGQQRPRRPALKALLRPRLLPLAVLMACNGIGLYGVVALYETFLRVHHHFSLGAASVLFALNGAGNIVGGAPLGYLADRVGRRRYLVITSACAAVLGAALFLEPGWFALSAVTAFAFGAASNSVYTNCYAVVQDEVEPEQAPLAVGALATVYFLVAAGSGPLLVAAESVFGWSVGGGVVYAVAYLVGFAAILTLKERTASP